MDISGVDVAFLSDDEVLELCSYILDCDNDKIYVLEDVNIDNLSDNKLNELYYDVMYKKEILESKAVKPTDWQVLNNNYNIVDVDKNEIIVFNGKNIDVNNLSDEEMISLYDDFLESGHNNYNFIAVAYVGYDIKCTVLYKDYETYGRIDICTPVYTDSGEVSPGKFTCWHVLYASGSYPCYVDGTAMYNADKEDYVNYVKIYVNSTYGFTSTGTVKTYCYYK